MKYFYTDPLAAAWMIKHFGVSYSTERFYVEADYGNPCKFAGLSLDERGQLQPYDKIYIHPDSLYLFEPQYDDFYIDTYGHGYNYRPTVDREEVTRIIQRNGIAFHWPEQEA